MSSGRYKATISAESFGTTIVDNIVRSGSDAVGADATLRAATSTKVEITTDAATIDTQDQTISQTLNARDQARRVSVSRIALLQQQELFARLLDAVAEVDSLELCAHRLPAELHEPYFNITDVGGSIGGPVKMLKNTWFFAAYEHNSTIQPTTASSTTLPHPSLLTEDFSGMSDSTKPLVGNAVLTPSEIENNTVGGLGEQFITIPARLLNPITTKLISVYFPRVGAAAPITLRLAPSRPTTLPRFQGPLFRTKEHFAWTTTSLTRTKCMRSITGPGRTPHSRRW